MSCAASEAIYFEKGPLRIHTPRNMEWNILLLLLATVIACSGGSSVFGRRVRPTTDLVALESSTNTSFVAVAPPDGMEEEAPSESKRSEVFRDSGRTLLKPPSGYKFSVQNVTNSKYNYMQWYAEPKGQSQNHARNRGSEDLNAQSSSYSEGYTQGKIDYHHHHDEPPRSRDTDHHYHYDHFHEVGDPSPREYEKKKLYSSYETPKPRTRKLKKKCKDKNKEGLSTNAHTLVHSMTKQTGAEVSQFDIRSPLGGGSQATLNPKPSGFSLPSSTANVGGKTIDNGNHLHIHSHHYHYDAEGRKVGAQAPALRNIVQGIQKLLPLALSGVSKLNHVTQSGKPMMDPATADVKLAEEGPKKGYHYTGPHNSYGKKTYHRMKESNPPSDSPSSFDGFSNPSDTSNPSFGGDSYGDNGSSDLHDHSSNMFNYGPFATDEYRDGGGPFPNEVSLSVDRPHSDAKPGYDGYDKNSGYDGYDKKPGYEGYDKKPGYEGYDSGSHEHPRDYHDDYPHHNPGYHSDGPSYSSESPSYNNNGGDNPISSAEHNDNKPYVPYDDIKANREKNAVFVGYGKQPETDSYSHPPSGEEGPDRPLHHSFSYSGIEEIMYDPEKHRDLKPEPDPLSIPKNARVIEHHIRLDPKLYTMYPPLDLPNQHIPLHKLIPDPLKYPPLHPAQGNHHNPQLNQMLHAYQSRSVYHKWW